jgi:uncharacterized membrane protein YbhN (UPF0104 family)
MHKKLRSALFNVLKIMVSAGMLVYVLFVQVDLGELAQVVAKARWGLLVVAALVALAGVALRAVRWLALLRGLQIEVPLGRLINLYFVGSFFNTFLPTSFGGDAIRMVELARHSQKAPEAIGTVLVDRANGLWVLFVLGLLALPLAAQYIPSQTVILFAAVYVAGVAGGWVAMGTGLLPWLGNKIKLPGQAKLERFYRAVSGCGTVALAQASVVSLIFNLMQITVRYLIALGLNVRLPLGIFFAFAPILSTVLLFPSIGGLGVSEMAHTLAYGTVDVESPAATAMSLARFGAQTLIPGLIGGLLYIVEGATGLRNRSQTELQD